MQPNIFNRTIYLNDNLDVMRKINSESIDLIATDPPYNKGKDFHATPESLSDGASFQDRWSWKDDVEQVWVDQIEDDRPALKEVIDSARAAHSDAMGAFVCWISVRLLAMHRILKPTGALFLQCDDAASAYIKAALDSIFGVSNFRNEITWKRSNGGKNNARKKMRRDTDRIMYYAKSREHKYITQFFDLEEEYVKKHYKHDDDDGRGLYRKSDLTGPGGYHYDFKGYKPSVKGWCITKETMKELDSEGRIAFPKTKSGRLARKRYLSESKGVPMGDIWTDINMVNSSSKEDIGYPTQKPVALYERIINCASQPGDLVLDPFCGCATTLAAAERLGRQWVGVDLWVKGKEVLKDRLEKETDETISFIDGEPTRTDDGETSSPYLKPKAVRQKDTGPKMTHAEMKSKLVDEQGILCQGCGRAFDHEAFLELDHNLPRKDGGSNSIENRTLLCRPCNGTKSFRYTLSGLREQNRKSGFMFDESRISN